MQRIYLEIVNAFSRRQFVRRLFRATSATRRRLVLLLVEGLTLVDELEPQFFFENA